MPIFEPGYLDKIKKIREYFNINKMQFRQTIHTTDLEYELMDVDGVRAVNFVELTQNFNDLVNSALKLENELQYRMENWHIIPKSNEMIFAEKNLEREFDELENHHQLFSFVFRVAQLHAVSQAWLGALPSLAGNSCRGGLAEAPAGPAEPSCNAAVS